MSEPIDLERERLKRLPQTAYVDLTFDEEPGCWLQQVVQNGVRVPNRTGVWFGLDGVPGVIISAAQAREFAAALLQVADHPDAEEE